MDWHLALVTKEMCYQNCLPTTLMTIGFKLDCFPSNSPVDRIIRDQK